MIDTRQVSFHNVYDPRGQRLIRATGNPDLFPELKVPESTTRGWLRCCFKSVAGAESLSATEVR
jgi:hypothetical protein